MQWYHGLLMLHVAAGSVALLSGPVPMLARKGGRLHRRAGKLYVAAMAATAASALILAVLTGKVLFLALAVFTFFLIFNALRALSFRRRQKPANADHMVCGIAAAFSAWLLWHGIVSRDVTSLFFSTGAAVLVWRQWRRLRHPGIDWLSVHLSSMGAAYITTATAFIAANSAFLPQAVAFVVPSVSGTLILAWITAQYSRAPRQNRWPGESAAAVPHGSILRGFPGTPTREHDHQG